MVLHMMNTALILPITTLITDPSENVASPMPSPPSIQNPMAHIIPLVLSHPPRPAPYIEKPKKYYHWIYNNTPSMAKFNYPPDKCAARTPFRFPTLSHRTPGQGDRPACPNVRRTRHEKVPEAAFYAVEGGVYD